MAEQEHRVIYLEPRCAAEAGEDRHWCQDDAWGACDECGTKSVKYIIASEYDALMVALKSASTQCGNVIYNCEQKPADNRRHLDSWCGVKAFIDTAIRNAVVGSVK